MAGDLRMILAVLRIGHELERSGDLMKSVVKATRQLYPHSIDPKLRGTIARMGEQAANEIRIAIDAFADSDPSRAAALFDMDDLMDDLTKSLFRYIMNREGPHDEGRLLESIQLALVGSPLRADRRPCRERRRPGRVHRHRPARGRRHRGLQPGRRLLSRRRGG